jgi:serine/threonine protein kinase
MVKENDIETTDKGIQYKYLKLLGQGTFGQAWKAENTTSGEFVVIKVYKNMSDVREILIIEKNALEYLTSKSNLCEEFAVCYKDAYSIRNEPRLVMEFIDGSSLKNIISDKPLYDRESDFSVLKDLIIGLDQLHAVGITHQDIKEDNIMWDDDNVKYRFLDWGGGCVRDKYCKSGGLSKLFMSDMCNNPCGFIGTTYTAPPEMVTDPIKIQQNQNFDATKAHDIWSIGVVLYDWFTFGSNNPTKNQDFWTSFAIDFKIGTTNVKYLSQYSINELHRKINDFKLVPFITTILKMLLDTKDKRLKNWNKVVELVKDDNLFKQAKTEARDLSQLKKKHTNDLILIRQEALRLEPCGIEEVAIFKTLERKNYCITYNELNKYLNEKNESGKFKNIVGYKTNNKDDFTSLIFISPYTKTKPFDIITIEDPIVLEKIKIE